MCILVICEYCRCRCRLLPHLRRKSCRPRAVFRPSSPLGIPLSHRPSEAGILFLRGCFCFGEVIPNWAAHSLFISLWRFNLFLALSHSRLPLTSAPCSEVWALKPHRVDLLPCDRRPMPVKMGCVSKTFSFSAKHLQSPKGLGICVLCPHLPGLLCRDVSCHPLPQARAAAASAHHRRPCAVGSGCFFFLL